MGNAGVASVVRGEGASTNCEDGFCSTSGYKHPSKALLAREPDMRVLAAAFAFLCLSAAALPALAKDPPLVPAKKYPGWSTNTRETGTVFFYCTSPKICGKGSIVSLHFHDLPAPTKADIRAKFNEPRLPVTCRDIGEYESCEYPTVIDKKGRPTYDKLAGLLGIEANFMHTGFLSRRVPPGAGYNFLVTIVSSAMSYQQAKKNYAMVRSTIAP